MLSNTSAVAPSTAAIDHITMFHSERLFTIIHVSINILLMVISLSTTSALIINHQKAYRERRIRLIATAEAHLLLGSLLFSIVYLPIIVASLLGLDVLQNGPLCDILIWLYGSTHGAMCLLFIVLAACWLVRVQWPTINQRAAESVMVIIVAFCWIVPAVYFAIVVATADKFSLPSQAFCMNDLDMFSYEVCFILPCIVVCCTLYLVTSASRREWKKLLPDLSPRLSASVVLSATEASMLYAHSAACLMFLLIHVIWKTMFSMAPTADYFSPLILHTSFIVLPLIASAALGTSKGCLTLKELLHCFTRKAPVVPAMTGSGGSVVRSESLLSQPPPYEEYTSQSSQGQPDIFVVPLEPSAPAPTMSANSTCTPRTGHRASLGVVPPEVADAPYPDVEAYAANNEEDRAQGEVTITWF